MKFRCDIGGRCIGCSGTAVRGKFTAEVERAKNFVATAAVKIDRFHDVDLARGGPGAVGRILRQHPECGPQALACRQLDTRFDPPVFDREAILGIDSCGRVG